MDGGETIGSTSSKGATHRSLRASYLRVVVVLVLAVATLMAGAGAFVIHRVVTGDAEDVLETSVVVLARAVAFGLDRNDLAAVREPLHGFFERDAAVFAVVLDRDGVPLQTLGDWTPSLLPAQIVEEASVERRGDLLVAAIPVRNAGSERWGTLALGWRRDESAARATTWSLLLAALALGASLVAGLIAWAAARRFAAPLESLALRVSTLAEGNPAAAPSPSTPAEIRAIDRALDDFSARFRESREALERQTRDLEQKVRERTTELRQKHFALALQNEQILESSRLKSAFLANMSHELRTPLHAILALSELLRDEVVGELSNDEQRRQVTMIHQSGQNLLRLINDVLDLSKIEAGKMELRYEAGDPQKVLRELIDELRPLAESKDLAFDFRPEGQGDGWFDADRLRQVAQNLIGNAIKFTETGSVQVRSRLDLDAQRLTLDVKDTGVGIGRDNQETIFQEFRQVDGSASRRFGGTGLGLAICHRLIRLMGGEIWVESEVGRGSTFTVQAPIRRHRPGEQTAPQATQELIAPTAVVAAAETPHLIDAPAPIAATRMPEELELPSSAPQEEGPPIQDRARILVIEDDDRVLESLVRIMALEGFDLRVASDGREALAEFERDTPDLVVLDLMLPGLSGFELLERFSDAGRPRVPIVVHTAKDLTRADWKVLDRSVERVFHKTGSGVRLMVDEIHRLLEQRRRPQGRRAA